MSSQPLNGKTALITGGGSGIGLETARLFLAEGGRVAIAGRDEEKLHDAWRKLGQKKELIYRACDVAEPSQVDILVSWAVQELGRIDILVNNAGTNVKRRLVSELSIEDWQRLIRTNLDGAFYCVRAVLPQMRERRDGIIINVVSTAGKRATPLGGAAYSASKFGMAALGHCLGIEEMENGVRCAGIYPGEVDTPLLDARPQKVSEEHIKRILKAEDVAQAVLFVATLPPNVTVPELIIKPACQPYA